MRYKLSSIALGSILALILAELVLRIYNPYPASIRHGEINLRTNVSYSFVNPYLKDTVTISKNKHGFRGPNYDGQNKKLICIGGSTTFCANSDDKSTWPYILGQNLDSLDIWTSNAGISGHSTFGHLKLLDQYLLEINPDYLIFLLGINDLDRDPDKEFFGLYGKGSNGLKELLFKSEVLSTVVNLFRNIEAKTRMMDNPLNFDLHTLPINLVSEKEKTYSLNYSMERLPGYQERLSEIISICRKNKIKPIFINQPLLTGNIIDPSTGINLSTIKYENINGSLMWEKLSLYNEALKKTCDSLEVPLIDLAEKLPKDSRYYRDFMHYSVQGNKKIVDIILPEVLEIVGK